MAEPFQLQLLDPGPEPAAVLKEWPAWYTPSKHRKTGNVRVSRGGHPMGGALGPEDSRCGTCQHLAARNWSSRTYHKCNLRDWTCGAATDVMLKWRGCEQWEAAE